MAGAPPQPEKGLAPLLLRETDRRPQERQKNLQTRRGADGGKTWRALDRSQNMVWRPFYFANLIVDPKNDKKLYKPGGGLSASNDGGESFTDISGAAHGDFHDVWVDPQNTDHLITGDEIGLWYSYDGGNR